MRVIAPPHTPLDAGLSGPLILRDGSVAIVRPAGTGDRDDIRRFFHTLSPEARRSRFLAAGEVSDEVVDRFCARSKASTSLTLLAVRQLDGEQRVVAVASYERVDAQEAEVAFAVDERFQHQGIATALLERLASAASDAGFAKFQALTLADNSPMLSVFRDSGFTIRSKPAAGCVEVELALQPSDRSVAACEDRERAATAASIRPLLEPNAIAVVGVSRNPASLGRRIFDALVSSGFAGPLYPVNPSGEPIGDRPSLRSARDIPAGVDLAVVATPASVVLQAVDDCAAADVRSLVVITAGFAEAGEEGRRLERALVSKVRGHGMRMVGPNCMGLFNTALRMNASFSPLFPVGGQVALLSQSGALGIAIVSLASERGVGLSTFVSVGNKADVSGNDLLQYWEQDSHTSVILLYLESFGNPRRFARLARRIGHTKPIVVVKSGRTRAGSRAAGSHTAALAASDVAVDALLRQSGVIRATTMDEMFDVAACLDAQPLPPGRRVAIVTNAGGPGILAVDACEAAGLTIAELPKSTRDILAACLPPAASLHNPVDMIASAGPDAYRRCVEAILSADDVDALVVIHTAVDATGSPAIHQAIRDGVQAARAGGATGKPVVACLMAESGHRALDAAGERIPVYAFPENAARALGKIADYARWRNGPQGLFWSFNDIRADEARSLCRQVVDARGDTWLTAEECRRVVAAFGLPLVPAPVAHSAEEAVALAEVVGFPVVAKLSSTEGLHKSDIGGVRLGLNNPRAVRKAYVDLLDAADRRGLSASIEGVLIQPMVSGVEMLVGIADEPLFGSLIGVGLGGTEAEALGDVHFRVAPLTDRDAAEVIRDARGFVLLDGYRGRPKADVDALADVVLRVSQLAEDVPEIAELDFNPVIVMPTGQGCRIVDARIRVRSR